MSQNNDILMTQAATIDALREQVKRLQHEVKLSRVALAIERHNEIHYAREKNITASTAHWIADARADCDLHHDLD